jgi:CBS domain-containing protein
MAGKKEEDGIGEVGMNPQLVKDWMTRNPITITAHTSLTAASRLMKDNNIRRLPVVDRGM